MTGGGQTSSLRGARASPFRETDWDRKLDSMLEDLEGSGGGGGGGGGGSKGGGSSQMAVQQSYSSSSTGGVGGGVKSSSSYKAQQQSSYSATSMATQLRSQQQQQQQQSSSSYSASSSRQQQGGGSQFSNGYAVATPQPQPQPQSLKDADNMLKDLEGSLKASSNFLESHRTVSGPGTRSEYHEYRSYSSGGTGGGGAGSPNADFNLERQVQHMMPPGSLHTTNGFSSQQQQQQQQMSSSSKQQSSYTSYKVQSNQYGSGGERIEQERPGSRLKQNIDDLDSLLYDLNHAQNQRKPPSTSGTGGDYTASDDYSFHEGTQGHVKKTASAYNEQSYQVATAQPPSPIGQRRTQPRRQSPQRQVADMSSSSSYKYSYSSRDQQQQQQQSMYPSSSPPPPATESNRTLSPSRPLDTSDGRPAGVTYYAKYHSTHSHASQGAGPSAFPSSASPSSPSPHPPRTQSPPTRVDQLMTELSEFDSSIRDTSFVEPVQRRERTPEQQIQRFKPYREPSPERKSSPARPQQSTPGPAVYYPPGTDLYSSKPRSEGASSIREMDKSGKRPKDGKIKDPEGKQGAAVVPICLPLCCAAPCVIM